MSEPAVSSRLSGQRTTSLAVVLRALFVYLCLVWIMIRLVAVDEHGRSHLALVAAAVLLGFPIAAGVARLLHRRLPAGVTGGWGVSLAAVATALLLPVTCLQMTADSGRDEANLSALEHQIVPAALVQEMISADDLGGLRLRIRGLSLDADRSAAHERPVGPVMLLLDTSLQEREDARHVHIEVRLIREANDQVLWRDEYVADPDDVSALRRVLIRALTEGMSRTREGIAEGQLI